VIDPDDDDSATFRLQQLLATRAIHTRDLLRAEADGDIQQIAQARVGVRTMNRVIRRYCAKHGLPRPVDVPEKD
jgi:hypothetical protein